MDGNRSRPSGGPAGGTVATRKVTIAGVTVWITADGRRWLKEPARAPLGAVPAATRVSGAPSACAIGDMLRPGGVAPWLGLTIGGRMIESVGFAVAA